VNLQEAGELIESPPIAYSATTLPVDMRFLDDAMSRYRAPVVREILYRFVGNVTAQATATGLPGKDGAKLFARIRVNDRGGELVNLPGAIIRQIEQMEYGDACQDDEADLGNAANDASYDITLRTIFDPSKSQNDGRDTGVPLLHFVRGGSVSLQMQAPVSSTVASGTIRVYFRVEEERERTLKSRMVWRERTITAAEDTYDVNGSLRAAFVSSVIATTGYTSLSSHTEFTSNTLFKSAFPTKIVWDDYRRKSAQYGDLTRDSFLLFEALPLVSPDRFQRIGNMMDLRAFHLRLASAPTSGTFVTCHIEDRNPSLAAEWMGYNSVAQLSDALEKRGYILGKGRSRSAPYQAWDPVLRRRLPVAIDR
jgi:hypothetical protein